MAKQEGVLTNNADGPALVPRNKAMQGHGIVLLANPPSLVVTLGVKVILEEQEIIHAPEILPCHLPNLPRLLFAALNTMIRAILENA